MAVFRRADFEARVERVRRRQLLKTTAAILILAFGYPAVLGLHVYGVLSTATLRHWLLVPLLGFVAAWALSWMSLPRLIRRMGLSCPVCTYNLWATGLGRPGRHAVLESGRCPKCGTELLDAAEAGARPAAIRWQDDVGGMTLIALMLMGLVAFVYFGKKSWVRRNTEVCARRYAAANTAADTIRVNRSGFRRFSGTCEDYRR